jgi:hypothetical protein
MNRLESRLTYANVMSTLCFFLLLGGGAYAAGHLGKNSVGSKQLQKNAVTTAKVKNEAITAAKVKKGTLTGTQINASTLGKVPNATHADTANSADTAHSANTANSAAALAPPEAVHYVGAPGEPTLGPSFIAAPEQLGFYRDRQCTVHLLGETTGPSSGGAFILPEADWPKNLAFEPIAVSGSLAGSVEVVPDGEVRVFFEGGGSKNVGLAGVTFRAAAC